MAELWTPHRVHADRKDVVAPNCEGVMVIGSGVSFFEFLESVLVSGSVGEYDALVT